MGDPSSGPVDFWLLSWTQSATSHKDEESPILSRNTKITQVTWVTWPTCDPKKQGAHAMNSHDHKPRDQQWRQVPKVSVFQHMIKHMTHHETKYALDTWKLHWSTSGRSWEQSTDQQTITWPGGRITPGWGPIAISYYIMTWCIVNTQF